jgi:PleD family two-component response regulator
MFDNNSLLKTVAPQNVPQISRVLIVTKSRTLKIAQAIHDYFEYREVNDGESAWEVLLLDPSIKLVVSEVEIQKLDSHKLLKRIRSSRLSRIKDIPFVSIVDKESEQEKVQLLDDGATDLISTKDIDSIATRLKGLIRLSESYVATVKEKEAEVINNTIDPGTGLMIPNHFKAQLDLMWGFAKRSQMDIALICLRLDPLPLQSLPNTDEILSKIELSLAQMLSHVVRKEDAAVKNGVCEFLIAGNGIKAEGARLFARRLANALSRAKVTLGSEALQLSASFGLASLMFDNPPSITHLNELAMERVNLAQSHGGNRIWGHNDSADSSLFVPE